MGHGGLILLGASHLCLDISNLLHRCHFCCFKLYTFVIRVVLQGAARQPWIKKWTITENQVVQQSTTKPQNNNCCIMRW